jgi:hypothetical protein
LAAVGSLADQPTDAAISRQQRQLAAAERQLATAKRRSTENPQKQVFVSAAER